MALKQVNTRELVVNMLLSIEAGEEYSHILMREVLAKYDYLEGKEKAFIKRVMEGSLERQIELDYRIDYFSKTKVAKMKPFLRALIRMSAYQLLYMDKVPDSAVINEAVKLAKKRGFQTLSGFVNGVLRNLARQGSEVELPKKEENFLKYCSIKYSMPEWIIVQLQKDYGCDKLECILSGLLEIRPVTIRFSEGLEKEEIQILVEKMWERGITVSSHPYHPKAYLVSGVEGIYSLPGYEEGKFTVQDVSSMLAVEAAGLEGDEFCLDLCAAPGGKALFAGQKLTGKGRVEARDLTEYKTAFIQESAERLQLTNISISVADGRILDKDMIQKADVVLADVPCLGLGVMGKKRDIKYRLKQENIRQIVDLQKQLLQNAIEYVKSGGTLLYSTCSMTKEENEQMVTWMEENYPVACESLAPYLPKEFMDAITDGETRNQIEKGQLQLLPGIHMTDGFFMARLKKK